MEREKKFSKFQPRSTVTGDRAAERRAFTEPLVERHPHEAKSVWLYRVTEGLGQFIELSLQVADRVNSRREVRNLNS